MGAKPAAFNRWPASLKPTYGPYRAVLDRWKDADTAVFLVDFGLDGYDFREIRLLGYSSPESDTPTGRAATEFANRLAPPGTRARLHSDKDGDFDPTFTRWVARIELEDRTRPRSTFDYGEVLYAAKHARVGAFEG